MLSVSIRRWWSICHLVLTSRTSARAACSGARGPVSALRRTRYGLQAGDAGSAARVLGLLAALVEATRPESRERAVGHLDLNARRHGDGLFSDSRHRILTSVLPDGAEQLAAELACPRLAVAENALARADDRNSQSVQDGP